MPRSLAKRFSKNNRFQEKITPFVAHYLYSLWTSRHTQRLSYAASKFLPPKISVHSNWLISNCQTHLAYKYCHWLISISTGSIVNLLRMKTDYHWLIPNDPIHAGYTNFHWLISISTNPIVKLLKMNINCYWIISNDPTHISCAHFHWLISISINPILKIKGPTLCGSHIWHINRHDKGDMNLGALTCLPPYHVTFLASCQNWSHDLAQCQVPVTWLGTLPRHVSNLGNLPISVNSSIYTQELHFFNHFHKCSFAGQNIPPATCSSHLLFEKGVRVYPSHLTWHHAQFPPCDLTPCQVLWRHLAHCQLTPNLPPDEMGPIPFKDYCKRHISTKQT